MNELASSNLVSPASLYFPACRAKRQEHAESLEHQVQIWRSSLDSGLFVDLHGLKVTAFQVFQSYKITKHETTENATISACLLEMNHKVVFTLVKSGLACRTSNFQL